MAIEAPAARRRAPREGATETRTWLQVTRVCLRSSKGASDSDGLGSAIDDCFLQPRPRLCVMGPQTIDYPPTNGALDGVHSACQRHLCLLSCPGFKTVSHVGRRMGLAG